jgi:hypothetical protein
MSRDQHKGVCSGRRLIDVNTSRMRLVVRMILSGAISAASCHLLSACTATTAQAGGTLPENSPDRFSARFGGAMRFTLVNDTPQRVCFVNIGPSSVRVWGDDWLGATETIAPGARRVFHLSRPGDWDVQALACNRDIIARGLRLTMNGPSVIGVAAVSDDARPSPETEQDRMSASDAPRSNPPTPTAQRTDGRTDANEGAATADRVGDVAANTSTEPRQSPVATDEGGAAESTMSTESTRTPEESASHQRALTEYRRRNFSTAARIWMTLDATHRSPQYICMLAATFQRMRQPAQALGGWRRCLAEWTGASEELRRQLRVRIQRLEALTQGDSGTTASPASVTQNEDRFESTFNVRKRCTSPVLP